MDPIDIDIVQGTGNGTFDGPTVAAGDIAAALATGTSVTVQTNNQNVGGDLGNLTQDADALISVTMATAATLTFQANNLMTLSGGISVAAGSAAALTVELDELNSTAGTVTLNTTPISTNGSFTILGGNVISSVGITAQSIKIASGTTTIGATSVTTGSVSISGALLASGGNIVLGGTTFTSTTGGTITTSGTGTVAIQPSGAVSIGDAITTGGGSFTGGGSTFSVVTGGSITTAGGAIDISPTASTSIAGCSVPEAGRSPAPGFRLRRRPAERSAARAEMWFWIRRGRCRWPRRLPRERDRLPATGFRSRP